MKKVLAILTVLILCLSLSLTVFAKKPALLVDDADLLSESEERNLLSRLESIGQTYEVDVVIVTTLTLEGKTPEKYANRYYDEHNYGQGDDRDGVLLLVSMEDRDWYILTNGLGADAVNGSEIEDIGNEVASCLGDADYGEAFDIFVDACTYEIDGEINGFPFRLGKNLLIALAVGLVIALIVTGVMRAQLKSVRKQLAATEYTKQGSMQVTASYDLFLYRTVDRRKKETSKSSSSGGSSRGGGGGKF